MDGYEKTGLWKRSLGDNSSQEHCENLRTEFRKFREKVGILVSRISSDLPSLTVHDLTHLDALWEVADVIAGDDYPLNPLEGFIFGGAVLLHDAALCFEAYKNGISGIRETVCWLDSYAYECQKYPDTKDDDRKAMADFAAVRHLHSQRARELAKEKWMDASGEQFYLIQDASLRQFSGEVIGKIAASHHWNIEDLLDKFKVNLNPPGGFPKDWEVDLLKIACLLRCADAAHIDNRRAPDFLYALIRRSGLSQHHWQAQKRLGQVTRDQSIAHAIRFTSTEFTQEEADAWWVAYDAICLIQKEIKDSNDLLSRRRSGGAQSLEFYATTVLGVNSPEEASEYLRVSGWTPYTAPIHVSDVQGLVLRLGGEQIYGKGCDRLGIILRELIQNGRDAIVARRHLDEGYEGKIKIKISRDNDTWSLELTDDGVGMSRRVLTGSLLDFGQSFWSTNLVHNEFPGLRSKNFESVGQFGIGFYSVFMGSDKVEVVSRNFRDGIGQAHRLVFPNGLSLRPILSKNVGNFSPQISTKITCTLSQGLILNDGAVEVDDRVRHEDGQLINSKRKIRFNDYVRLIALGLDVDVHVAIADCGYNLVHRSILSICNDESLSLEWIKGMNFHDYSEQNCISMARNLRIISENKTIYGYAAINFLPEFPVPSRRTVGGFPFGNLWPEFTSIVGFIDHNPSGANRNVGKCRASKEVLEKWVGGQVDILKKLEPSPEAWAYFTNSALDFGVFPKEIACFGFFILSKYTNGLPLLEEVCLNFNQIFERLRDGCIYGFSNSMHPSIKFEAALLDQEIIEIQLKEMENNTCIIAPLNGRRVPIYDDKGSDGYAKTFAGVIEICLAGSGYRLRSEHEVIRKKTYGFGEYTIRRKFWVESIESVVCT